jgi:hypothetical protein
VCISHVTVTATNEYGASVPSVAVVARPYPGLPPCADLIPSVSMDLTNNDDDDDDDDIPGLVISESGNGIGGEYN